MDGTKPFTEVYNTSPSLRGRGLKLLSIWKSRTAPLVALFTRAWIEILQMKAYRLWKTRRPLYEGVDWNTKLLKIKIVNIWSPSLRGRGLKFEWRNRCWVVLSRPLYEGVDWNPDRSINAGGIRSRPLYEGVDWNDVVPIISIFACVALFTRAWIEMSV